MMEIMKITPKIQKAVMDGSLKVILLIFVIKLAFRIKAMYKIGFWSNQILCLDWINEFSHHLHKATTWIWRVRFWQEIFIIDILDVLGCKAKNVKEFEALDHAQKGTCMIDKLKYMSKFVRRHSPQ